MYVARRSFRNNGQMITPGSTVEPGAVKWFKTRLKDRIIIEVNAHNFDIWKKYFADKYHVNITLDVPAVAESVEVSEPPKVIAETADATKVAPVKKVVVKVKA